ncbi:MAG: LamG-like jellyroll fold domain-containing protein [Desulfomonilia bacterium]
MRKLIISLLLFLPLYIIKAQGLSVGTVNAGISGAEMRTVLNTNFSNIKTAVDLKAPLTGSAPGLTVGNVSWIHRDGNSLVSFGTYGGVPGYGSYQFYTPSTGGSNYFYLPLSGTVVMTDPQDTVHFFRGVRLKFPGGHLGWNNSRLGKGWLTDLDVTNTITGSISGNAATVTGFSRGTGSLTLSGNHALTLTTTAATNVTLPTTGTLMTNPMSASGDLLYGGASGVPTRLQAGTNGHVLTLSSGVPSWQEPAAGGLDEQAVIGIVEGVLEDALEDAIIGVAAEDVLGGSTGRDRYMSPAQIESYVSQHGGALGGIERVEFSVGDDFAPADTEVEFLHSVFENKQVTLFRDGELAEFSYITGGIEVDPAFITGEHVEIWLWPQGAWKTIGLGSTQEELLEGLGGFWRCEQDPATGIVDEMGNHSLTTGTPAATLAIGEGIYGNAVKIEHKQLLRSSVFNQDIMPNGEAFAFSMWFYLDSLPSERGAPDVSPPPGRHAYLLNAVHSSGTPSWNPQYAYIDRENETIYFRVQYIDGETTNYTDIRSNVSVTKEKWYHVVLNCPGAGEYLEIWLDGVNVSSSPNRRFQGVLAEATAALVIGRSNSTANWSLVGMVDDMLMYPSRALSEKEIKSLFAKGRGFNFHLNQ